MKKYNQSEQCDIIMIDGQLDKVQDILTEVRKQKLLNGSDEIHISCAIDSIAPTITRFQSLKKEIARY